MRVTRAVELAAGLTATFFNLLLIPIILTRSSARIGKYKYFLLAYTINASYFTIMQIFFVPTWFIPPNGYFFLSTVDYFPRWIQQIGVLSFVGTYSTNIIILTWSFVYRLTVIESPYPWIIHLPYFPFCLLFSIILASWMVGSCKPIMPSPEIEQIFHEEIFKKTGIELADVGYIGGEITINGYPNIGMAVCLGSFIAFVFTCCIIYIICWFKIGRRLKEMRDISGNHTTYHFQYRLFVLLSLQTCMPIVFNIFPAASCFILSLAQVELENLPYFCAMILTFAQIADPIFTIFFIAEYKRVFTKWFHKTFPKVGPTSGSGIVGRSVPQAPATVPTAPTF